MLEGIIIKGYSGFYYVQAEDKLWECSLRGKYRVKEQDFLVGDKVLITPVTASKGVIEKVIKRENQLVRPPIANVEQVVIVMALMEPAPDLNLLDRLLILSEYQNLNSIICFNKADLVVKEENVKILSIYKNIGYRVFEISATTKQGIVGVEALLKDKISVLAGPSGAGKSSLLNAIQPEFTLKTGSVSEKTQRGKHTTRHVELLKLKNGGYVADTPGFSRMSLPEMPKEELAHYFLEIAKHGVDCRFTSCIHQGEPGCAVDDAYHKGLISEERLRNYYYFLGEVKEQERRY